MESEATVDITTDDNITAVTVVDLPTVHPLQILLYRASQRTLFKAGLIVGRYLVSIICIIGLVGNALSILVMFQKHNRKISCCLYMALPRHI